MGRMGSPPLAISPSQRSPGLGIVVNFTAGAQSPGNAPLNALLIAPAGAQGTIAPDTQLVTTASGPGQVGTLLQQGTPGHLAAVALFAECPNAQVDVVAPAASAGNTAAGTITFSGTPASPYAVTVTLCGRQVQFSWNVGESAVTAATKCVAALAAIDVQSPVAPSNGAGVSATCTLTAKIPGNWGNDITYSCVAVGGAGGSVTPNSSNLSSLSGGTLEPSLTNVLALLSKEYTYILFCTSNADAGSASSNSNVQALQNQVAAQQSGTSARLQQVVLGVTGTLSAAMVGTAKHDFGEMEYIFCQYGQSLPAEWGGAECGARLREVAKYAAINRINMNYVATLYGPQNMATQQLSAAQEETALFGGISPVLFDAIGNPRPARPATTYFADQNGNPDPRILDTSIVDGIYTVARDLRTALPEQFANKSITENLPDGADSLPANVVEIRDVKAFIVTRCLFWARTAGVLQYNALLVAIGTPQSPGSLIVQIDPTDPSQVDIVLPLSTVPPFAKTSLYIVKQN